MNIPGMSIDSIRDRAIFRLAYHAGLRASEVGKLEMRDYDADADRIFIHRLKGSHSGHHHLMREENRALRAWLKVRGSFPGPIFLSGMKRPIDRQQRGARVPAITTSCAKKAGCSAAG